MHIQCKHSTQMYSFPNSSNQQQTTDLDSTKDAEVDAAKQETEIAEEAKEETPEDNNSSITVGPVVLTGIITDQIAKIQHRDTSPMPLLPTCKVVALIACTCDKKG
eukprot:15332343-Ditylum_brightwellii.AAC.1